MNNSTNTRKHCRTAAIITASIALSAQIIHAEALAYEGFDYVAGPLGSAAGGVGFASDWTANGTTNVAAAGLTYGDLEVSGGNIGNLSNSQNRFGGSRQIDLTTPGLLADGSELWFSVIGGYDTGGNRTNSTLMIILGDEPMSGGNFDYNFNTVGATGVGVFFGRAGSNGRIRAVQARDTTFGDQGFNGNVYGTEEGGVVIPSTDGNNNIDSRLVVGRITWGATTDTIDLFLPETDLTFDALMPHATLSVDVDQSGFDFITFKRGDKMVMDELRFGATAADVLPVEGAVTSQPLVIASFTSVGENLWEVGLSGNGNTDYSLYSSDDLSFGPGTLIENLTQGDPSDAGTVGGLNNSVITLDETGLGLIRVSLTGDPRSFIRAEVPQPLAE